MSSSQQTQPAKLDLSSLPAVSAESSSISSSKSPQLERDAARAMSSTDGWKPALGGRKQSYHKEDHKRELQMSSSGSGGGSGRSGGGAAAAGGATTGGDGAGAGFSEHRA
ncbi:hypothetical protein GGR56DRAFT_672854 [Xylariaceae sp. FL0804]|nr:hypothetical protein GGR56DRAFT_672854 [Xylariaceae sp. FL0804]